VHFTFTFGHERVELYLYSPYGPYGLYRASVPVKGCTLPFTPLPFKIPCPRTASDFDSHWNRYILCAFGSYFDGWKKRRCM